MLLPNDSQTPIGDRSVHAKSHDRISPKGFLARSIYSRCLTNCDDSALARERFTAILTGELHPSSVVIDDYRPEPSCQWWGVTQTYFARMETGTVDAPIKIGSSNRPRRRLEELRTGSPYPITVLATFPASLLAEAGCHEHFAADRMRREWFRPSAGLSLLIRDVQTLTALFPLASLVAA